MSKWDDLYYRESSKRERALQEETAVMYEEIRGGSQHLHTFLANCYHIHPRENISVFQLLSLRLEDHRLNGIGEEDILYLKESRGRKIVPDWQIEIREILTSMHLTYEVF